MDSNQSSKETSTDTTKANGIITSVFKSVLSYSMPTWIKLILGAVVGAASTAYYLLF